MLKYVFAKSQKLLYTVKELSSKLFINLIIILVFIIFLSCFKRK